MPIYEYECLQCGQRTERLQRMDEPPLAACPACGGPVKKLFSAPAAHFKGSGWYVTDYGGHGKDKGAEGGGAKEGKEGKEGKDAKEGGGSDKPAAAEKGESKGESKASEGKPAGTAGGSDKSS